LTSYAAKNTGKRVSGIEKIRQVFKVSASAPLTSRQARKAVRMEFYEA
jgi:hypothetical protein